MRFNEIRKQRKAFSGIFFGIVTALFIIYLEGLLLAGWVQLAVLYWYIAVSIISFVAYFIDKSAAKCGKSRIRERTLHIMALTGGWPGAWLAQTTLHHKTAKSPFQRVYGLSVFLNILGFVMFFSPAASAARLQLL